MIEVQHLTKKYGSHTAVEDLSFTVQDGQIYGFLGPNGAGKSTTMNIMTGYIGATAGTVIINGHDILEEPEEARACIGFLPEQPPLYTDMTVNEYLKFAAELKKIPRESRKEAIETAGEKAGVTAVSGRVIRNLSKGFRQRVGLAQAILGLPPVIILDEPTVGLDPKQVVEIRDLIRSLSPEHTVILSSHILSEISAVCDHILIISHGRLVASDTPEHLGEMVPHAPRLRMIVKGSLQEVEPLLQAQQNVTIVEIHPTEDSDAVEALLETAEGLDVREELSYELAVARHPVLQMSQEKASLEELFLKLTGEGSGEEKAQ